MRRSTAQKKIEPKKCNPYREMYATSPSSMHFAGNSYFMNLEPAIVTVPKLSSANSISPE